MALEATIPELLTSNAWILMGKIQWQYTENPFSKITSHRPWFPWPHPNMKEGQDVFWLNSIELTFLWKQWLAAYFCPIFSRWYPVPMLSPSGHSRLSWLLSSYRFHNPQGVQSVSQSLRAHVFINLYEVFGYLHWNREIVYGRGALYWSDCVIGK